MKLNRINGSSALLRSASLVSRSCSLFSPRSSRFPSGLTLVEVLLSVAILGMGTVFVLQGLSRGAYVLSVAERHLEAYQVAQQALAEFEVQHLRGRKPREAGRIRLRDHQYMWHLSQTQVDPMLPLYEVSLEVEWRQGKHAYDSKITTLIPIPENELEEL